MKKSEIILGSIFIALSLFSFVFAAHVVRTSSGGLLFSFTEDTSNLINISVNITDGGGQLANVTQVNVTLPSGFIFDVSTNGTSTNAQNFTNISSVLSWSNSTGFIINATSTNVFFWFNATMATPGSYNLTITTLNASTATQNNISIIINDTTAPSNVSFISPTLSAGANSSSTSITLNVSVTDNVAGGAVRFYLYNSAGFVNNTNVTTTGNVSSVTFSGLAAGNYTFNATANDTSGNLNGTGTGSRTITLDTTAPSVSISETSSTQTELTIAISTSDTGGTGVTSCTSSRSGATFTGTTSVSEEDLNCGTDYTYNITCTDYAGNQGSDVEEFTTDACSSSGGSSGGSSSTSTTWKNTFVPTDEEIEEGYEQNLEEDERVRVNVDNGVHHVGVTDVSTSSVTIEVSSSTQTATLNIGDIKKFDVTDDNYYDISVELESISGSEASVEIKSIYEAIPAAPQLAPETTTTAEEVAAPQLAPETGSTGSSNAWVWIIVVVIIIAAIVFFVIKAKKKTELHKRI